MTEPEKMNTLHSRASWLSDAVRRRNNYPHRQFHLQELEALEWAIKKLSPMTEAESSFLRKPVTRGLGRLFGSGRGRAR